VSIAAYRSCGNGLPRGPKLKLEHFRLRRRRQTSQAGKVVGRSTHGLRRIVKKSSHFSGSAFFRIGLLVTALVGPKENGTPDREITCGSRQSRLPIGYKAKQCESNRPETRL
jgi:hypothetical protein